MSGTGNRRLAGWLSLLLAVLLAGGWLTYDQFASLLQPMLQAVFGVHA